MQTSFGVQYFLMSSIIIPIPTLIAYAPHLINVTAIALLIIITSMFTIFYSSKKEYV